MRASSPPLELVPLGGERGARKLIEPDGATAADISSQSTKVDAAIMRFPASPDGALMPCEQDTTPRVPAAPPRNLPGPMTARSQTTISWT
jgi:hypothetical protein